MAESLSHFRYLKRDGSFNVEHTRKRSIDLADLYHSLLAASWAEFLLFVVVVYLAINSIFGLAYFFCAADSLEGVRFQSPLLHYSDCFFFSVQTFATIGYGRISPIGLMPNLLVTFEALTGLFSLAVVTGLLFARFARPTARVVFSNVALIGVRNGIPSFFFRMTNERQNHIVDAAIQVSLVKTEKMKEGGTYRNFYDLKLIRSQSPLFGLMWTVVHPIDKESPLYGMDQAALIACEAEIIVSLTGMDDIFYQNIFARFSYTVDDMVWNARFVDMLSRDQNGKVHIEIEKIHQTSPLAA